MKATDTSTPENLAKQGVRVIERLDSARFSWSNYLITLFVTQGFVVILIIAFKTWNTDPELVPVFVFVALILGSLFYFSILTSKKLYYRLAQRSLEGQLISADANSLQEVIDEDFFTNLVRINFKYIDKYYLQTQVQADKSFFLCIVAATISLIIVIIGIALMFAMPERVQPAYLTTATGALGEIISAVFFYLYNRTILEMSEYHQKLVLTQNIGLALKIADGLPEASKADAHIKLIQSLSQDINMYLTWKTPQELLKHGGDNKVTDK